VASKQAQFERLRNNMTMEQRGQVSQHLRTREGKKHDVKTDKATDATYGYWVKYLRSIGVKEPRKKQQGLDHYNIAFTYIKAGDTARRSAVGYKDMRRVRGETYRASHKYKGGRAYRVKTVNVSRGREVK